MLIIKNRSSRNKLLKCFILSQYYNNVLEDVSVIKSNKKMSINNVDEKVYSYSSEDESLIDESCTFVGYFTDFAHILGERVIRSLSSCGYYKITPIQKRSIPIILDGCDVLIRSATGSGKTLTFLVPTLQRLVYPADSVKITRKDGTKLLIMSPTRELSIQTAKIAKQISKPFPWIVISSINGGDSKKSEKASIRKGITIIVGTPGRILDHCETTSSFKLNNLDMFVLDEADRLLDMGFESRIKNIYKYLLKSKSSTTNNPSNVQVVLTSATLSDSVKTLADFCLRTKPVMIGMDEELYNLPANLSHEYVLTDCKNKFMCLLGLLLHYVNNNEKVIIFVSNCNFVIYMYQLIKTLSWPTLHKNKNNY